MDALGQIIRSQTGALMCSITCRSLCEPIFKVIRNVLINMNLKTSVIEVEP